MIFVTLGSQKFPFNRILKKIDDLIKEGIIKETVFAQIGYSDYEPKFYGFKTFLSRDEFAKKQQECDIVITHGGTGAIIGALRNGKKVIAVPRLAKYGEHIDDHQLQILHEFEEMNIIEPCYDLDMLKNAYVKVSNTEYNKYISNTDEVIASIDRSIIEDTDIERGKIMKNALTRLFYHRV